MEMAGFIKRTHICAESISVNGTCGDTLQTPGGSDAPGNRSGRDRLLSFESIFYSHQPTAENIESFLQCVCSQSVITGFMWRVSPVRC